MKLTATVRRLAALALVLSLSVRVAIGDDLSVSARRTLEDVKLLASDEFEGRGVGTSGLERAADYIAEEFRKAGLNDTAAGGGPFEEFEISDAPILGSPNTLTLVGPHGQTMELKYDEDFRTCAFGASGKFEAPVVFAGYGIEARDVDYDDFAGVDVAGKVVIVMRRNPRQGDPHGPFAVAHGTSRHAALTTKLSRAAMRGAVAVLIVNDPYSAREEQSKLRQRLEQARSQVIETAKTVASASALNSESQTSLRDALTHLDQVQQLVQEHDPDPLMEFGYGGSRSGKSLPCFQITQAACDQLLKDATNSTLADLEPEIDRTLQPASRLLEGWSIRGEASLETHKVPVKNVIGVLEGTGPHKDETIVIGAHFDHLGYGGEGSLAPGSKEIHNGADDNASGTAGLLELARRFGSRNEPLPRRLVFIAFTGEERGLLGSEQYVSAPLYPLNQTIAMFNMDMIGRMENDKLTIFGTGTSSRWDGLLDRLAAPLGLTLSKQAEGFGPSDHATFYAQRIPVLHLFSGAHGDYHRPTDDWEKINAAGMSRIVDLLEAIVLDTAQTEVRPDYAEVQGRATLERSGGRPYFGSIPSFGKDVDGYAIQGVSPDSPAQRGGVQSGDVIVRLGSHKIGSLEDFDLALREFSAGEQVEVLVLRDGKELSLKVTLGTPRG